MNQVTTFFLRISSICNLDCDYCYVFKHQDHLCKQYPSRLSQKNFLIFAKRLKQYVIENAIEDVLIVFHGGEPLTVGDTVLISYIDELFSRIGGLAKLNFSVQTNATLLNTSLVAQLALRNVKVSVSIDGPANCHNLHRKDKLGECTHSKVLAGINCLREYPGMLTGIITVIDPTFSPHDLFEFYVNHELVDVDLLLPDANYISPPYGKSKNPDLYCSWLKNSFDLWFQSYNQIKIRSFELIIQAVAGLNVCTDMLGGGKLSYLTIETDGSYHTSDILKVAYEGASQIGMHIKDSTIKQAIQSPAVQKYNFWLDKNNLPSVCQCCDEVNICGGGCLPHRFSRTTGFSNPTIYCEEMKTLIKHARNTIINS